MSFGLFEHLAAYDDTERVAARKAVAVANKRVTDYVGDFLKVASTPDERKARLALVSNDIDQLIASTVEEYGGDYENIRTAVVERLAGPLGEDPGPAPWETGEAPELTTTCGKCNKEFPTRPARVSQMGDVECPYCGTEQTSSGQLLAPKSQWGEETGESLSDIYHPRDPESGGYPYEAATHPFDESSLGGTPQDPDYQEGGGDPMAHENAPTASCPTCGTAVGPDDLDCPGCGSPDPMSAYRGDMGAELGLGQPFDPNNPEDPAFQPPNPPKDQMQQNPEYWRGASVHEARRPKMCPYHSELVDASLQAGEPQYAAFSGLVGSPSHCKGGFNGTCNFKPDMVAQSYWDGKQQEAKERQERRELERAQPAEITPVPEIGEPTPEGEGTGITDINTELIDAPSAVGEGTIETPEPAMAMATSRRLAKLCPECEKAQMSEDDHALVCPNCGHEESVNESDERDSSVHTADADRDGGGAVKREDLPTNTSPDSWSEAPSPKTDHRTWKPNALNDSGNLSPVDSEMSGSPNKTDTQDIADDPDYEGGTWPPSDTNSVTDREELTGTDDDAVNTERNISQEGQSDTWHGTSDQASPVTETALSSAQNPIRNVLRSGFATASEVTAAISKFRAS